MLYTFKEFSVVSMHTCAKVYVNDSMQHNGTAYYYITVWGYSLCTYIRKIQRFLNSG